MRRGVSEKTWTVALSGVLAAMSLALLYLASVLPTGQLGVAAVAGLFPMAAVISAGWKAGVCCWLASGLLGLLIVPGKGIALLFLLFFGLYPVVKSLIERMKKLVLEWICKLILFNADLLLCLQVAGGILMGSLPEQLRELWLLWPVLNAVFIVYDIGLSRLAPLYINRVDRRLRK